MLHVGLDGTAALLGADDFLRPELEQRGYKGAFMPKCSSPAEAYGCPSDGCALFYRTARFQPLSSPVGALPWSSAQQFCMDPKPGPNSIVICLASPEQHQKWRAQPGCLAGLCFHGPAGKDDRQGMLQMRLADRRSGRQVLVSTVHLKAKAGAENDAIRRRQVCSPVPGCLRLRLPN